uniref:Uncharacterized protein n=1 Tax=Setaria viridis TaxID=4556 RepID=A0A4U6UWE9_SETVI|nr:hypothetical protein SEVIR_4G193801v2 [Setaria viridis]
MDFGRILMMHDVDMALDAALPRDENGCGVRSGTAMTLTEGAEGDTRSWKILYWSDEANKTCGGLYAELTCRVYCKADEGFSLTVRDGAVCLAPTDADDEYQHWIQDKRPGNRIKDMEGYPAFVLVNRVTGDAIMGSDGDGHPPSGARAIQSLLPGRFGAVDDEPRHGSRLPVHPLGGQHLHQSRCHRGQQGQRPGARRQQPRPIVLARG